MLLAIHASHATDSEPRFWNLDLAIDAMRTIEDFNILGLVTFTRVSRGANFGKRIGRDFFDQFFRNFKIAFVAHT